MPNPSRPLRPCVTGLCLLLGLSATASAADEPAGSGNAAQLAAAREQFDWSEWRRLPVLHEGRIQPLDTFADEMVTLATGRPRWSDPETKRVYKAHELLYAWITDPESWLDRPVIRCEYRPLRALLDSEHSKIEPEGTYVSLKEILDWDKSSASGVPTFWSKEVAERSKQVEMAAMQGKDPDSVGDTAEDRAINGKLGELIRHLQAFLTLQHARNVFVVPGLDPRILAKQTNPDARIMNWAALGALLRPEDWRSERDVTVAAVMAESPAELLNAALRPEVLNYPPAHLPQLAQAQTIKEPLQVEIRRIKPALDATRAAYDKGDAAAFRSSMQTFVRELRQLAGAMEEARPKMTAPKSGSVSFGPGTERIWEFFEPLELSPKQMSLSAYPPTGSTDVEIVYNKFKPFQSAWIVFLLAAVVVLASSMVKTQRSVYVAGLCLTFAALAYSAWGFALRIIIAGRPPVTNMYETVIWVSFVVSALGLWFCLFPLIWPGLQWSWRLTSSPLRWRRNEDGAVRGVEIDELLPDERARSFARFHLPIRSAAALLRIAGFIGIVAFLSRIDNTHARETSFQIITLIPPIFGKTIAWGSLGTWLVGTCTVVLAAWYLPRATLTALGTLLTAVPEARRDGQKLWEQTFARRYFLLGALPVSCFGMVLAHFVGISSPDILNPRIGSIAAVLRNNYWLFIHVLTIVSSYGAGALAWGLGNVAMLYYLFGKYRSEPHVESAGDNPSDAARTNNQYESEFDAGLATDLNQSDDSMGERLRRAGQALKPAAIGRTLRAGFQGFGTGDEHLETTRVRPPHETATLATFAYKAMQSAVLLLAAGTILGGLWADVSWGRFWDWDPKEVWALISLLVYLVVLHGRFAGWVGTFGTNVGSAICFTAIMMSWYGVNFVLPQIHGWLNGTNKPTEVGLHSYATGAGGLEWVLLGVLLNYTLVLLAWGRYAYETMEIAPPPQAGENRTAHSQAKLHTEKATR